MVATRKPNELTLTRVYAAPVQAVWDAWTDPEQTAQWWGPRGFTITTHSKDLRPAGHWKYTMHGPDGVDYPNTTKYFEVENCAKLVYDHGGSDDRPPLFRVTVLFSEQNNKTTMQMTMTLPSPEAAREIESFIKKASGYSTWDRLAEYLEKSRSGREQFVINRTFAAPIELIFQLWTDPKRLAQWLPPTGMEMEFLRADIRPGGSAFYKMFGGGICMYGRANYHEIREPDYIVYTQQFVDENEQLSHHPMAPVWPATMRTVLQLTAEESDRTRVTITWEPHGEVTPEELDVFIKARPSMTQGWTGSFDKLEERLKLL